MERSIGQGKTGTGTFCAKHPKGGHQPKVGPGKRCLSPFSLGIARNLAAACGVIGAIGAISLLAPTEETMGHAQRIVYVHVAVAWLGLAGILTAAAGGLLYLLRRDLAWDHRAQAAAEVGWVASSLTLVTGSLWAHEAWGSWWTWDPRLTTALVLWTLYCGYLIVRNAIDDPHRRARVAAAATVRAEGPLPAPLIDAAWRSRPRLIEPCMDAVPDSAPSTLRLALSLEIDARGVLRQVAVEMGGDVGYGLSPDWRGFAACVSRRVKSGLRVARPTRHSVTSARLEIVLAIRRQEANP